MVRNEKFGELLDNEETKFLPATDIKENEIECSHYLKDQKVREIALSLRKSGGLLENDLIAKSGDSAESLQPYLKHLVDLSLINIDYVVVCNQSNKQINRAKDLESLNQLDSIGVTCSCGRKISEEKIEKLYSPLPLLQTMLDKSYWMSAYLISLLQKIGIPNENILINLAEGPEEIDAIVDIDGSLVMFELKDNEFSMGHAYPFQARISIYSPEYSIIVATKGVSQDVKNHFVKVKPETEMSYVDNLDKLEEMLKNILFKVRSIRAINVLMRFDRIAMLNVSFAEELGKTFNIEVNSE